MPSESREKRRLWGNGIHKPQDDSALHPNAFKHTFLSAVRTQRYGTNLAVSLNNAHETGEANYNPVELGTLMDSLNNAIGVSIGQVFPGTIQDMANFIFNEARAGHLWTINFTNSTLQQIPF